MSMLSAWLLPLYVIFPTATSILVLAHWHGCPLPRCSSAGAAGAGRGLCRGAAGLCPWLGSCCCSCECLPQPFPRAVLLGFYLPCHSPGWALAMSGWCRKAVYAAHEGWLCSARPFFFSVATSLAGTRSMKQSNQMKCISAEEMPQFTESHLRG